MEETKIIGQEEKVKLIKGMAGKYSYEITLLGKPEDNLTRIGTLKGIYDKLTEVKNE